MTEQGAQALAQKWVRIWLPDWIGPLPRRGDNHPRNNEDFQGLYWDFEFTDWRSMRFMARVAIDALLMVDESYEGSHYAFWLVLYGEDENAGWKLRCGMDGHNAGEVACDDRGIGGQAFTSKWLPIFRRNCWLSGCPVEASAHEKAEWIRDFSREEIETWDLKV